MTPTGAILGIIFFAGMLTASAGAQTFLDKPLADWLKELASADAKQRRSAAFAIGKMGDDAGPAVSKLMRALRDPDPGVSDAAAFALGEIGAPAREAVPLLTVLLNDRDADPKVRRSAAYALGSLKANGGDAVTALARALDDPQPAIRQNAAWALGRLTLPTPKPIVQALEVKLADGDAVVRRDVAAALGAFGRESRPALPSMLRRLPEEIDPEVRKALLNTLVNLVGPDDGSAAAPLRAALGDKDSETALLAALALGNIGGNRAAPAVPLLRTALADPTVTVRRQAAGALTNIGPDAAPAVADLCRALTDDDPQVQSRSALALGAIGPAAKAAAPHLIRALRSRVVEVRLYAIEALARIESGLDQAVSELARILREDPDVAVRQRAVWALGRVSDLEGSGAATALASVLTETAPDTAIVRYEAARYLAHGLGGKTPDKAIEILTAMLSDTSIRIYTRTDAKVTSGAESGGSTSVAPNIGGDGRTLPAMALGAVGPKANRPEVVRALQELARSREPRLKEAATDALKRITGK